MIGRTIRLVALGLLLTTVGTLPACSPARRGSAAAIPRTYVQVNNQSWLDMTVYVVRGAQRIRIGQVTSNATTRLLIPQGMVTGATSLSFVVDPIGSQRTASSFEITVTPGETVQLTIPPTVR